MCLSSYVIHSGTEEILPAEAGEWNAGNAQRKLTDDCKLSWEASSDKIKLLRIWQFPVI